MINSIQEQRIKNQELTKWEKQGATVTEIYVGDYEAQPISIYVVDFRYEESWRDDQVMIHSDITWSPLIKLLNGHVSWSSGPGSFAEVTTEMITDVMILAMKKSKEIAKEYGA